MIKNQTRLADENTRMPFYLKIVNEAFKESKKIYERKPKDPADESRRAEIMEIVQAIVTRNRVEKELFKCRDEGLLPEKLTPQDLGAIAKLLPKRVYDDCLKEERELVVECGEYFGKACQAVTMGYARAIVLGTPVQEG